MGRQHRYRLQRKEQCARPNILGNCSQPVHTYQWRDVATSKHLIAFDSIELPEGSRIIDSQNGDVIREGR